jgi:hypothetical protein
MLLRLVSGCVAEIVCVVCIFCLVSILSILSLLSSSVSLAVSLAFSNCID